MNIILLVLVFLVLFLIKYLPNIFAFKRLVDFSKTVPGPGVRELIANAKRERVLTWLKELTHQHGSVFRIWFGKDLNVFFSDPDDVKLILGSNQLLYKSNNYVVIEPWLGKGLLTNGGLDWHKRRKMLTPAFHFKTLSEFKQPMEENCDILISRLSENADGKEFDVYPYITLFALDAICETAMGIKKNAQLQSFSEYVMAVQTMCSTAHKQSFSFWNRFNIIFRNTTAGKEQKKALKILHNETMKTIELRRKYLEENKLFSMNDADKQDEIGAKRRLAFLDILLIAQMEGANLTDTDIREEVDTFMFEGHDTTSSAIGFALYCLSQNPDAQEKALQEAIEMQGKEKEPMKYIEAVIKETLRLFPAVPSYSRRAHEDFHIRDMTIPKGTNISILTYMIHRDTTYYPDPEKFKPERFLDDENDLHPFAFVAFSAGPRNCIGQRFAMLELKLTLSKLLRAFELLPAEEFKPFPLAELVMKSGNGIRIRMVKRKI